MKHDRNFLAFMEKCISNNLTLNSIRFSSSVQSIFLRPLLVKTWYFTRSKEDSGTQSFGIPTGQGNYEIFPRGDQLPEQV